MLNKLLPYNKSIHQGDLTYVAMYLTLSDPGNFRQLTTRWGGGVKSHTPPPTISKPWYKSLPYHTCACCKVF